MPALLRRKIFGTFNGRNRLLQLFNLKIYTAVTVIGRLKVRGELFKRLNQLFPRQLFRLRQLFDPLRQNIVCLWMNCGNFRLDCFDDRFLEVFEHFE